MAKRKFKKIEKEWQKKWEEEKAFQANPSEKEKFFITIPYPYVNGAPHIGAGFTFIRGDVYARFKRMQGFNVLYPQGFHATGEPIVGVVKRLREGDKSQIEALKMNGITDKQIEKFKEKGSKYVAKYWKKRWIDDLKSTGFSIDWRRTFITTPITPTYSRFIEWQYNTLKEKGYVVQGTHPVVWCPECGSPTGDHDRLEGVGESPIEYTVIKFRLSSGDILPCATLRPETVYGVTNIWVDPDVEYVKIEIDGEKWILSSAAAKKLGDQLDGIEVVGKIQGSVIVGKSCENPITKTKIPVLPADFCDTEMATGIVMSVPSHAPYDWMGLEDLKKNEDLLKKYNIENIVKSVNPISLVNVKGFGEHPAKEICENMGIGNQKEEQKLEKATETLYKKEFHTGICNEKCGRYNGMKISEAKKAIIEDLVDSRKAVSMWETTGKVICRCKTKCHIKILKNQWFLKYSDEDWKKKVHECIDDMKFYPEEARQQFKNTVDWLKDKACTRRSGMGTPLPWDDSWIVETLSDSTIYMAYYTISKIINERMIKAEVLTDEAFDYIFLGKGDSDAISNSSGIDKQNLEDMRREFEYFYPVDLRNSGKDLVQNHLTFYIFQHVAIWDKSKYPKAIGVNGYVNVGGEKMSKSKGNFIPLKELVKKYGADLTRINIVASNENMDDADWREDSISTYESRMGYMSKLISGYKKAERDTVKEIDRYMISSLNNIIQSSTDSYEEMKFRSAVQSSMFMLLNEIRWYIERCGGIKNCNKDVLRESVETLVKIISPVIPHLSEEWWAKMGKKTLISLEKWPEYDEKQVNKDVMQLEEIYKKTMSDIRHVVKLASEGKSHPKNLYLYFSTAKELNHFTDSEAHLQNMGFKKIKMFLANDENRYDPGKKAKRAKYGKPAIYLE